MNTYCNRANTPYILHMADNTDDDAKLTTIYRLSILSESLRYWTLFQLLFSNTLLKES